MRKYKFIIALAVSMVFLTSCFGGSHKIEVRLVFDDGTFETRTYDKDTSELVFSSERIAKVEGLEKFPFLERLVFDRLAFFEDYESLRDLNNVETLMLSFMKLGPIDFLHGNSSVRNLVIQASSFNSDFDYELDISGSVLEYIEITDCALKEVPVLVGKSDNLQFVNLGRNQISCLNVQKLGGYDNVPLFLVGNPLDSIEDLGENIIVSGNYYRALPDKYKVFLM